MAEEVEETPKFVGDETFPEYSKSFLQNLVKLTRASTEFPVEDEYDLYKNSKLGKKIVSFDKRLLNNMQQLVNLSMPKQQRLNGKDVDDVFEVVVDLTDALTGN